MTGGRVTVAPEIRAYLGVSALERHA